MRRVRLAAATPPHYGSGFSEQPAHVIRHLWPPRKHQLRLVGPQAQQRYAAQLRDLTRQLPQVVERAVRKRTHDDGHSGNPLRPGNQLVRLVSPQPRIRLLQLLSLRFFACA